MNFAGKYVILAGKNYVKVRFKMASIFAMLSNMATSC